MSCFSRASQAVLPNRDRNEQVSRVVNRTYVNKVCIFYFFYYFILKNYLWENTWSFISYDFLVWRI